MLGKLEMHVWWGHGERRWARPECGVLCPLYDHSEQRTNSERAATKVVSEVGVELRRRSSR
jgi:hypothetical protein